MRKIVTIHEKKVWSTYVQKAFKYDFYHTWYYHSLDKSGLPILFIYQEKEDYIAFPLLKRSIPGSDFYDFTSVYGYAGPISNVDFKLLDDDFMERFKNSFLEFLKKGKSVSVFSRLHPFFDQIPLMEKFKGVHSNGKTVAIDLTMPIETQRSVYRRSFKEKIKWLRKHDYKVKMSTKIEDASLFFEIYTENMKRVGAKDYYLFSKSYFIDLLASEEFESKLFFVYKNGIAVSGAVVICTNKIMQLHLLATRTAHLMESPAKLLTDEITIIGRQMGYEYFNLGGGVNFKEDSLFGWKVGFSNLFFEFNSWRFIADVNKYNTLLDERSIDHHAEVDFFPLYRSFSVQHN